MSNFVIYLLFLLFLFIQITNFATDFIKYKEGGRRAVGNDSASAASASASTANSNNNNPSAFVSANKKKKGPANK